MVVYSHRHVRELARSLRIEGLLRRHLDEIHPRFFETVSGPRAAALRCIEAHLYAPSPDQAEIDELEKATAPTNARPPSAKARRTLLRLKGIEHYAQVLLDTYTAKPAWLVDCLAPITEPAVEEAARLAAEEEAKLAKIRADIAAHIAFKRTSAGRREEARKKAARAQRSKLIVAISREKERMRQRIRKEGVEFPPGMLAMFYWGFSGSNMVDLNLRYGGQVKIADYLREKKKEFTRTLMADEPEMLAILVSDDHINREFKFSREEIAAANVYGERAVCYGRDRLLDLVKAHLRTFYRENPVTTGDTT